jgi:solute:Na+ symporter, SSS family
MHTLDWLIVGTYLVWIVYDGLKRTKVSGKVEAYFLANRSLPWWAVGLSVMATQLSAITLVGTTGQGYADGIRFVQFYFGLPLAMIILSLTAVPFFHRARVYTAYEFLEQRFDAKTRALTSLLFLMSRGLSCGVIVAAPSVILSIVLGWNLTFTILAIAAPTVVYIMFGGVQAVTWTDVKQMVLILVGVFAAVTVLILGLPDHVSFGEALHVAGATGRLQALDFSLDPTQTYTFWSGMIGGLFLMLSYFGCDQSQVQRYLTARSVQEGRHSLLMSAWVKIPLQILILLAGVLVFVFYVFNEPPMLFNRVHEPRVRASAFASEYAGLEQEFSVAFRARGEAAEALAAAQARRDDEAVARARSEFIEAQGQLRGVRDRGAAVVQAVSGDRNYNDVNYVFPTFIVTHMPIGMVGLMIAAIFAAAMSSIGSELNSLSTATVIDFYRRHFNKTATDSHYLMVSKIATGFWGLVASIVALYAANLGSLIEVVNRFGSFFYGSILGVFILAVAFRRATGHGAFLGLIAGMATVALVAFTTPISFLWHNVVGVAAVILFGLLVSYTQPAPRER